jgi:hypothetical protein
MHSALSQSARLSSFHLTQDKTSHRSDALVGPSWVTDTSNGTRLPCQWTYANAASYCRHRHRCLSEIALFGTGQLARTSRSAVRRRTCAAQTFFAGVLSNVLVCMAVWLTLPAEA